ncbi:MAG: S66 peptidase family protein [Candidatus Paceibacterota bacterium]|jgi:muramoyltetrapeptide carboxypeptidase
MIMKPQHLNVNDNVGIVSPSSPINKYPRRTKRGIESLSSLGLNVLFGPNSQKAQGHNAGTARERAEDINNFFSDPNIKGIIASTGGYNTNAILPYLDFENIKKNPKIFCGFSDVTVLNIAIYAKTGLVTFNGPTILPTFGDFGGIIKYSEESFKKALFDSEPLGVIEYPKEYTEDNPWWEKDDNQKREMKEAPAPRMITGGVAKGTLIVANLNTFCILGGTEYFPDLNQSILFLEEEGESPSSIERNLIYLEQLGVFSKIKGLVFARPSGMSTKSEDRTLYDVLSEFGSKYKIPVIADVDFGHTNPLITLPIGVMVEIDADKVQINIIESATL